MSREHAGGLIESQTCWRDVEMTELSLLLPSWQVLAMEGVANSRGLTVGQLVRLLISDSLVEWAISVKSGSINKQQ